MGKKRRRKSSSSSSSSSRSEAPAQPQWASQPDTALEIPDHLGNDVTFDQKKRLARLARMGLGPVARPGGRSQADVVEVQESYSLEAAEDPVTAERERLYRVQERRAALMEHERRLRMQQEMQEQEEARKSQEESEKRAKRRGGMASLGPVQPREDKQANGKSASGGGVAPNSLAGFFESAPARAPHAGGLLTVAQSGPGRPCVPGRETSAASSLSTKGAAVAPGKLAIKISTDTANRVHSAASPTAGESAEEGHEEKEDGSKSDTDSKAAVQKIAGMLPEAQVLASLRMVKREKESDSKKKKKAKKKKNNRSSSSSSSHKGKSASESGKSGDDVHDDALRQAIVQARHKNRDAGLSWKAMSGESVRGKVSNDNKRLTDADLERRFATQGSDTPAAGLMTEAQVLAMLQKEKSGKVDSGSSARRAKRELEEWTNRKKERMARSGPQEKERLVVSRSK